MARASSSVAPLRSTSNYLFTITQSVDNTTAGDVPLFPYARIVRQGTPHVQNFFVQHEGPLGVLGANNLVSKKYTDLQNDAKDDKTTLRQHQRLAGHRRQVLGDGDPRRSRRPSINAQLTYTKSATADVYQTSFVESAPSWRLRWHRDLQEYVFAGAKEEAIIDPTRTTYGFDRLELLIDWGWFYFLTKPMFYLISLLYSVLGNFGLAILAVTVIVKALFFPLANRSYESMAAMRRVQPEMK